MCTLTLPLLRIRESRNPRSWLTQEITSNINQSRMIDKYELYDAVKVMWIIVKLQLIINEYRNNTR